MSNGTYKEAVKFVKESGRASITGVQRELGIGYIKAAAYLDQMEKDGIVSTTDDSGHRKVLNPQGVSMKEILIAIEKMTKHRFAEVSNREARFLSSGILIPINEIGYQKIPKNGFYRLSEATCSGTCAIGAPKEECKENGSYSKKKCAVWFLDEPYTHNLGIDECVKVVQEVISCNKTK